MDKFDRIVNAKENEMGVTTLKPKGGKNPIKFEIENSPEYALKISLLIMMGPAKYGFLLNDAFSVALQFYGNLDFNDRENAIAGAFFELGKRFERVLAEEKAHKQTKGLSEGRKKGVTKRQQKAKIYNDYIRTYLEGLYKCGDGYKMTYDQIAWKLNDKKEIKLALSTITSRVKNYAPEIQKKYKGK